MTIYQDKKVKLAVKQTDLTIKTNLDTATPEQKEKLMKNLVESHRILYKSVLERRAKEILGLNDSKHSP